MYSININLQLLELVFKNELKKKEPFFIILFYCKVVNQKEVSWNKRIFKVILYLYIQAVGVELTTW